MKKILISLLHMKGRNVLTFLFMFLKKIAAFVDLVESRAREKFVPRHLTHYLSISIWPASSKAKKAFGRLYRFFFSFLCVLCWEKIPRHKRRQVLYVFNLIFLKWKLTEKSTRQPALFEFGLNPFFLFFQCQGLRVIFVTQHSLFEFEGLFQLGVYNLIIVIQTLRNKAMNRGTFWKGVWVVFIVFFSLSSWGFFFAPVEKGRGRPIKGWTPKIGTSIVIPGLVRPAATPEIESVDASMSKPTAA